MNRTGKPATWAWLLLVTLLAVVAVSSYAQDLIDVVTMKDGNIYKGVIIENAINDFIRIELSGGSVFRLAYEDIEKLERERAAVEEDQAPAVPQIVITQTQTVNQEQTRHHARPEKPHIEDRAH